MDKEEEEEDEEDEEVIYRDYQGYWSRNTSEISQNETNLKSEKRQLK